MWRSSIKAKSSQREPWKRCWHTMRVRQGMTATAAAGSKKSFSRLPETKHDALPNMDLLLYHRPQGRLAHVSYLGTNISPVSSDFDTLLPRVRRLSRLEDRGDTGSTVCHVRRSGPRHARCDH